MRQFRDRIARIDGFKLRALPSCFSGEYANNMLTRSALSCQEYIEIRNICLSIIADHASRLTTFVAIGRSPTALAAFMSQFRNVRLLILPGSIGIRKDRFDSMSICFLRDQLLQIAVNGREVVLIDYCLSGATLHFYITQTQALIDELKLPLKLKAAALVHEPHLSKLLMPLTKAKIVILYPLAPYPVLRKFLYHEQYDALAKYQPSRNSGFILNSEIYETFCANVTQFITNDPTLTHFHSFLRSSVIEV